MVFKVLISTGSDCINLPVTPARLHLSEGTTAHLGEEQPDAFPQG